MTVKKLYETLSEVVSVYPEAEIVFETNASNFIESHDVNNAYAQKDLMNGNIKVVFSEEYR